MSTTATSRGDCHVNLDRGGGQSPRESSSMARSHTPQTYLRSCVGRPMFPTLTLPTCLAPKVVNCSLQFTEPRRSACERLDLFWGYIVIIEILINTTF